jgi:trigger factor
MVERAPDGQQRADLEPSRLDVAPLAFDTLPSARMRRADSLPDLPSHKDPPTVKTSVETLDPVKVQLTVEVEPKRVKQAFDRAARELAKQVSLPGFRPGKAPRRLLEQRLGTEAIAQAAMEGSLSDYYAEALKAEDLQPVAQPDVDVDVFDEAEGARFTATVEVRPSFDPPDHTGISVTFPDHEVAEDEVDAQLQSLRERFAEVDEVDREARTGDMVTLGLRVEVDGEPLEDSTVEDALYEVGSEGVTPKLDEEVVGKRAGDEFSYEDELPEGYPEHGGEPATFHVTIKDVREKTLPDLDDDLATTASAFDTLDELKADIRRSLLRRRIQEGRHQLRGQILEAYLARVEVPLPDSMVEAEAHSRIHQLEARAERFGMSVEDVLAAEGTTREAFEENARKQAEGAVKAQLVLDALFQQLDIDLDTGEIDQEIIRHAHSNGMSPEEVVRIIEEQGSLPMLVGDIMRRKTIDAIVDAANVDGGPSDELLIELGLKEDPDAEEDDEDEAAPRLIVPGQEGPDEGGGELIVPGRD